jgi:hypothetical protein
LPAFALRRRGGGAANPIGLQLDAVGLACPQYALEGGAQLRGSGQHSPEGLEEIAIDDFVAAAAAFPQTAVTRLGDREVRPQQQAEVWDGGEDDAIVGGRGQVFHDRAVIPPCAPNNWGNA